MRSIDSMRINLSIETNKSPSKEWLADQLHFRLVSSNKRSNASNTTRTRKIYSPEYSLKRSNISKKNANSKGVGFLKSSQTLSTDRIHPGRLEVFNSNQSKCRTQENKCQIIVTENGRKKKYYYQITKVKELIEFLKQNDQNIVSYCTVPTNLAYDFYLTKEDRNASFFNRKTLHLVPYCRVQRKKVDIRSFQIIKCIGAGGFSKVFLVKFKEDGKFYAMKLIDKQFIVENRKKSIVMNERNIMIEIDHPFVLPINFAFESAQFIIFVIEYCPGGELFTYVKKNKRMDQVTARFFIIQILLGIEHLHQRNIIYRDIKPENILLDLDGHVRIADFGLAKPSITPDSLAHSFCGSPEYMAPQMILKIGHGRAVDFYCIGAMLYELVTGLPPFYSKNTNQIYQSTLSQQVTFPKHIRLSPECKGLIRGLLHKNHKLRLGSMFGVKEVLAHTWFGMLKRKDVLQRKLEPPIKIDDIQNLQFDFGNIKESDNQFISKVQRQQDNDLQVFRKVMGSSFYFDFRGLGSEQNQNKEPKLIPGRTPPRNISIRNNNADSSRRLSVKQNKSDGTLKTQISTREMGLVQLTNRPSSKQLRRVPIKNSKNNLHFKYT